MQHNENQNVAGITTRRSFVATGLRVLGVGAVLGTSAALAMKGTSGETVWQIDPAKCVACGKCTDECVLDISAVRCYHNTEMCGYCKQCFGFFDPGFARLDSSAENQMCPTNALRREFIQDPYHEYTVDRDLCIGCGKCVDGCNRFGNGSLFLQIDHAVCKGCNDCAIARKCPSQAIVRVPASEAYIMKTKGH